MPRLRRQRVGPRKYGVELHAGRGTRRQQDDVLPARPYHQLDQTQLEGAFNALFLNRPTMRDFQSETTVILAGARIEFEICYGTPGGRRLLVYVVPAAIVENYVHPIYQK